MSSQGLNSLATIIKRLEAATSRLEDIAAEKSGSAVSYSNPETSRNAASTLPARPAGGQPAYPTTSSPAAPVEVPASVSAFDERLINGKLKAFIAATKALNQPKLLEQANSVGGLLNNTREILLCSSACSKPSDADFITLIKPLQEEYGVISSLKDQHRSSREWGLHFQTVADSIEWVSWIQTPSGPSGFVKEQKGTAEYYGNRIIKEYKDKDKTHVDWVRSYVAIVDELSKYIAEYYKMGLTWNPKGGKVADFKSASNASASSAPPPPPPPPPPQAVDASSSTSGLTGASAVFAQINQGTDVTKGLRKVDKSEMTHKNPNLRATGPVPASSSPTNKIPPKPKKPVALQSKKPPKLELQGTKWVVEYQENERQLILEDVSMNQIVTLYGCKNTVVHVKGKVNGVSMTNCQKTSLLVESVVSLVSITNSSSFQLQITGSAPTIQIETTDSGQVYLSKACLGTEIITAKCSAINISLPVEGEEDGIFEEKAVPEMLRTVIQDGKLVTTIVEHTG